MKAVNRSVEWLPLKALSIPPDGSFFFVGIAVDAEPRKRPLRRTVCESWKTRLEA